MERQPMIMDRKLRYKDVSFPHCTTDIYGFDAIRKVLRYFFGFVGLFRVSETDSKIYTEEQRAWNNQHTPN